MQAAVGVAQLPKLATIASQRELQGNFLIYELQDLHGLKVPIIDKNNSHVFYTFALQIDPSQVRASKKEIIADLSNHGVPGLSDTYPLLHLLPIFQEKIAYGKKGFPWNISESTRMVTYEKGICPVAEEMYDKSFFHLYLNDYELTQSDLEYITNIFKKLNSTL